MKPRDVCKQISKMALIAYVVLVVLSAFLLAVPGEYWPWFLAMAFVACVSLVFGPLWYRLLGAIALTFASILILADLNSGRHYQEQMQRIMKAHQHGNPTNSPPIPR